MDADGFEELLAASGRREAVPQGLLDRMVDGARPRRRRRAPIIVGAAFAAVALAAAATTSDQWLQRDPYAGVGRGEYRVQTPLVVGWTLQDGERDTCHAYLEYAQLTAAQADRADAWATAHADDYAGLGQRLVDAAGAEDGPYESAEQAVFTGLDPVLRQAAATALPEALPDPLDPRPGARVAGYTIRCERHR